MTKPPLILTDDIEITNGCLILKVCKSGATQEAAGAAAGELWYTSGHATDSDNTMKRGV